MCRRSEPLKPSKRRRRKGNRLGAYSHEQVRLEQSLGKELDLPSRKAEELVDKVFDTMTKALAGDKRIEIRGFGSFSVREYGGYTGRNPKTGEKVLVGGKKLPFFKTGKDFRERLNQE